MKQGFQRTCLGELLDFFNGKAPVFDDEGEFPVYGSNGVIGRSKTSNYEDAIILGRVGAYCGSVARCRGKFWASDNTIVAGARKKCDIDFGYYLLGVTPLNSFAGGAAQPLITHKILNPIEVFVPTKIIQKRIASILSAYDDLIENNRRREALLEEAARLLYREWFVRLRFPGHEHTHIVEGVPEGWRKATAFEAMQVMSGGTPKTTTSDFWGDEIPFYTPKDSVPECYVLDTEKHLTELGLNNCNSKLYPKDTIFITARGTVGNLNLAQRPMAMNQSCYALVGRDGIPQKFLFCAMREAIQHFRQHAVGAVFDAIIVDTFKLIPFVIPNSKLIRRFEEKIDPMFAQIENLLQQNQRLRSARDLLLPRLMSGKIEV
jgi:type I restriction enzyme S subunit